MIFNLCYYIYIYMPGTPLFGSEFMIAQEVIGGLGTYLPLTLLGGGKKKKSKGKSRRKSKRKSRRKSRRKSKRKTLKSFRNSLKSIKY